MLVVYDASQDDPKIQHWIDDIQSKASSKGVKIAIVANKCDLGVNQASLAIAESHAQKLNTKVFQVSTV